jgi:hypothetical protein
LAALQNIDKLGSLLPFAAVAHKITAKSEGETRQCGQSVNSLRLRQWQLLRSGPVQREYSCLYLWVELTVLHSAISGLKNV